MASSDIQRKLKAILCADVVGYSRLMGDDHEGTLNTLTECREVFSTAVGNSNGRVVNAPGDSILAEFDSVVDAVSSAVDIQRSLSELNRELPDDRRMDFRIGLNLGDVLVKDGDLYGDGVNVAARLESLADPGGICISGSVHDQVKARLKLRFDSMGEQTVKNIADPVPAYRILADSGEAPTAGEKAAKATKAAPGAAPPMEVPDKPSIAVLAFDNMSGDAEQEYFSDGISEDIITDLSKLSGLFVIARNSSFSYKGRQVVVQRIGQEMGVRFVLEGSVRKAGNRVRITAQLVEAETGNHLWAERYDRNIDDIFALQDEITNEIVTALDVKLRFGEQARVWRKTFANPAALDAYYRGLETHTASTKAGIDQAKNHFEEAIRLDPESPLPHAYLAVCLLTEGLHGWSDDPRRSTELAVQSAQRALELDPDNAEALSNMGHVLAFQRKYDEAYAMSRRAVELCPSSSVVAMRAAVVFILQDREDEAVEVARRAIRLSPVRPPGMDYFLGVVFLNAGLARDAIPFIESVIQDRPDHSQALGLLALCYVQLDEMEQAHATAELARKAKPGVSFEAFANALPFKDPENVTKLVDLYRKAGLA
ncbi:MAG: tetratricopeptide repeat protein [bacterium]